jgi:hypothetical protein
MVLTYIDSSVALAYLFSESRFPRKSFWSQNLTSSRLLQYEIWNRVHARGLAIAISNNVRALLSGVELLEMSVEAVARALHPFPVYVRTLDGLHLATMDFILRRGETVELASYDKRLLTAAAALGIGAAPL